MLKLLNKILQARICLPIRPTTWLKIQQKKKTWHFVNKILNDNQARNRDFAKGGLNPQL